MILLAQELFLNKSQRLEFTEINKNMHREDILKHYTFSPEDMKLIKKRRRNYNKIGFAVQLAVLKHHGWTLASMSSVPSNILEYISNQLEVDVKEFGIW